MTSLPRNNPVRSPGGVTFFHKIDVHLKGITKGNTKIVFIIP